MLAEKKCQFLNIFQRIAEDIYNKKLVLTEIRYPEKIYMACIKKTYVNPKRSFIIRGYHTFRMDREGHKGGVLIHISNSIVTSDFQVDTSQQA